MIGKLSIRVGRHIVVSLKNECTFSVQESIKK